jgi:DNA helicase-2/ATP-dependent DNA helicase PcrA
VFDVGYLAERFTAENISVTALNNYLECPIKYLFRNLVQLPDVYTPALRYGNAIHDALEKFFAASHSAGEFQPKDLLFAKYQAAMKESGFYGAEYDTFLLKGRQSLGMYYGYYCQDWSTQVALEQYIRRTVTFGDLELTLSGKIDKLEYLGQMGTGAVRVVDYKTGKPFSHKSTKAQKQGLERQIQFYHLLLQEYKQGEVYVQEAMLDFVEPTDAGEFEQKSLAVTAEDLNELKHSIKAMATSVLDGSFLSQGCAKKDCEHCGFYATVQGR